MGHQVGLGGPGVLQWAACERPDIETRRARLAAQGTQRACGAPAATNIPGQGVGDHACISNKVAKPKKILQRQAAGTGGGRGSEALLPRHCVSHRQSVGMLENGASKGGGKVSGCLLGTREGGGLPLWQPHLRCCLKNLLLVSQLKRDEDRGQTQSGEGMGGAT